MAIYSGFSHWKWWFSIVTLNYQRVSGFWSILCFWSIQGQRSSCSVAARRGSHIWGLSRLVRGPNPVGPWGCLKGFFVQFFFGKHRVFLRPEKWKRVVLILQFYTQHFPRHPSSPIPPPPVKNELQCLIDFFSHVGLGLKQITSIRPWLGFGAARDSRMPSLFINMGVSENRLNP